MNDKFMKTAGLLLFVGASACSAVDTKDGEHASDESLGSSSEALTIPTAERSDITVYNIAADGNGYRQCPDGKVLVGMDQFDSTHSIACKSDALFHALWDSGGNTTTNENINQSGFNGWDVPQLHPTGEAQSSRKVIGFWSNFQWVPIGVNFTKGTLRGRLIAGGQNVVPTDSTKWRSHSWEFVHYQLNGVTQEIHVCPSAYPYMHGAVVLLSGYPSWIQNPPNGLALGDLSCFSYP